MFRTVMMRGVDVRRVDGCKVDVYGVVCKGSYTSENIINTGNDV